MFALIDAMRAAIIRLKLRLIDWRLDSTEKMRSCALKSNDRRGVSICDGERARLLISRSRLLKCIEDLQ